MSAAETDEPIERRFGVWTHGSPRNNVLGGAQIPPREETLWGVQPRRSDSAHAKCVYM